MAEAIEDLVKVAIKKYTKSVDLKPSPPKTLVSVVPVVAPLKDLPNHVRASTLLPLTGPDFLVQIFSTKEWPDYIQGMIPQPKKNYILPPAAEHVLRALEEGDKTLIHGPTGAGKSSLVEHLCGITQRPFVRINATGDMDSSMIFGTLTASSGSTVWVDGVVTEAVKYGAVLCWDEWEVTPPEIMMGMQWLLETDSKLFLKEMPGTSAEKYVQPHSQFRIVCLGNTQGQGDEMGHYNGTNVQNTATLDRFSACVYVGYLTPDQERSIINPEKTFNEETVDNLLLFANNIRTAYMSGQLGLTMSPRTLLSITKKLANGLPLQMALEVSYLNKLTTSHKRVAIEMANKIGML